MAQVYRILVMDLVARDPQRPDGGEEGLREAAAWAGRPYRRYGYRLRKIDNHLGVHYSRVSRCLKRAEQRDV